MIKTQKQAIAVQVRRAASGKRGVAKAVRRWMKRTDSFRVYRHLTVIW